MDTALVKYDLLPPIPKNWNFDVSVDKVAYDLHHKWKNLTRDIILEFYYAHSILAHRGRPLEGQLTWASYCLAIDVDPDKATRWLRRAGLLEPVDKPVEERSFRVFPSFSLGEQKYSAENAGKAKARWVAETDIVVQELDTETGEILPA